MKHGSRRFETADLAAVTKDGRIWTGLGVVVARDGADSHFEIETDDSGNPVDVLVEVDLMPRRENITCRLAASAGGPGSGLWRVPPAGAEVLVMVPDGQLEGGPAIVAVLSTGAVPSALNKDKLILINPGDVILCSKDGKVFIGSEDGSGTAAIAFKDGKVNLGSFNITGGVSTAFTGIQWTPPGGGTPVLFSIAGVPPIGPATELTGKISEGSDKAEVKTP